MTQSSKPPEQSVLASPARLRSLAETALLDSQPERAFDRLTELASQLLNTPVSLVSLVTADRQFFKSSKGLAEPWHSARETALSHSFCQHVVNNDAPLCINDSTIEPLVAENKAIVDLNVMAYLGVPIHAPDRETLGALCVIDDKPRKWSDRDIAVLSEVAAIVEDEIALRVHLQQRIRAERELQQSEEQLRQVIDNLFSFVGLLSPEGILLQANQTALKSANLQPEDVVGKPFWETYWWSYSPAVQAEMKADIERAAQGERLRHDVLVRVAAGEYIDIDFTLAPIFDGNGTITHLVPSGLDITQRKTTEAALRTSEASFRSTFENAAVGIAHIGLDGLWLRVNQRLSTIVGYSAEELLQLTFQELTHPEDLANDLQGLQSLIDRTTDRYQAEKRYIHKDGSIIWIHLTATLQYDAEDQPQYFISVIEDICARKAAEARLRLLARASTILAASLEYEDSLQQVAELLVEEFADWCLVDFLTTDSAETDSAEASPLSLASPARTPTEQVLRQAALAHAKGSHTFSALARVHPRDAAQFPMEMGRSQVFQTGESLFLPQVTDEHLVHTARDEEHLATLRLLGISSALVVPLRIRDSIVGTLSLIRIGTAPAFEPTDQQLAEEIADRIALAVDNLQLYQNARQVEAKLRSLNETLEQQVAARTAELQRRNQELDHFAYIASHDLRAPLRAIDNLATWITEDAGHLLPQGSGIHLEKLRDRTVRMERLLTDLLAYSRADRYRGEPEFVDVHQLVQNVGELLLTPPFTLCIPRQLPTIYTWQVPLETVFRNLIINAIKHHGQADGTVTVTAVEKEDVVEFAVQDDGPGIDPIYHDRIFEIYKTLQPRDKVEGSGIGLSIVKKIIDNQRGAIVVESEEGAGATFRFIWPKSKNDAH